MRLPQDSVDGVVGKSIAVTMETLLQGAGRVVRIWAEGGLGDAVVLAVYAWSAGDHQWPPWTADAITAVTAGRLSTQSQSR